MSDRSSILDLPYIMPAQAQKHVTHNEALRKLDVLVQLTVQAVDETVPPADPGEGIVFGIGDGATGLWAGHNGEIAAWLDGSWHFFKPQTGWRAWNKTDQQIHVWNGTDWVAQSNETVPKLGVNATADDTNRLTVSAEATLLNNAGAGHQLKLNKASVGDTASLLYQTGFTGHAEMGLNGNNEFSIKLSPDGSQWRNGLVFDAATGIASGDAVQSDAADTTNGKLLRVGSFGFGSQVITLGNDDDLDTVRQFCALIGNSSTSNVPVNAPNLNATYVGMVGSADAEQGMQFLIETSGDQDAYFRADQNGWGDWRKVITDANMVGTVSQTGGQPTGAVVERGQNGDGEYIRFADGTQIATNANQPILNAPAPFVGTITKIDGDKLWIGSWF